MTELAEQGVIDGNINFVVFGGAACRYLDIWLYNESWVGARRCLWVVMTWVSLVRKLLCHPTSLERTKWPQVWQKYTILLLEMSKKSGKKAKILLRGMSFGCTQRWMFCKNVAKACLAKHRQTSKWFSFHYLTHTTSVYLDKFNLKSPLIHLKLKTYNLFRCASIS